MTTTIQQAFAQFRQNLEITGLQASTVSTRQQSVRDVMQAGLHVLDSFLTGSYSRNTMIAPLAEADIDIFFVLDGQYFQRYNGQNGDQAGLLDLVKRTLRSTYTRTPDISRNGQAVTVRFDDFTVDVVPGQTTTMWLQADAPGEYRGECAEYCGIQHANMAFVVVADSPEQFQAWISARRHTGSGFG